MAVSFLYEMVGNMLSNFVSDFVSNTVSSAGQRLCLIFKRDEDLERIRDTLTTVKEFSLDAEEKQESDPALKKSIIEVQDVVYDADDLLDEIDYEILGEKVRARGQEPGVDAQKKVRKLISSFGMGPRIKEIRERLDKAAADISTFNLRKRVVEEDKKAKSIYRETAAGVRSELIIGREKDKELIIESLVNKQNDQHGDIPIVAIVGLGGLGKTSLAQLVYADAKVKISFDQQIWVCVSEDFNRCMIFKEILKSLDSSVQVDNLNLDQVLTKLEEKLRGKRYLLVLDDVWNENNLKWDDFSKYLVRGAPGSKILVTTRSQIVASAMGVRDSYPLEGLSEDQSWVLFKQMAFQGQDQIDADLRVIGEDVARRCKGVPLALKCLGGLMRQKPNKNYWSSVQDNGIWKSLKKDGNTFPVLRLSYDHLPSHLKQCFVFCSLFPKDFKISKDNLIQSWRAQGYIQLEENENIQDIGDEYFNDLHSRSFFQEEEKDMYGNIIWCKMHDLIHDLAFSLKGRHFHQMKEEKERISKGVRHVSLEKNSKGAVLTLLKTKEIRTMFFQRYFIGGSFIQNVTFSSFNCLRMLNLSSMSIVILPDSIGELKHLRYLDLSFNGEMKVLPDAITKLHHLQTLLLNFCSSLEELPRDIQHLISLEYLKIDNCRALTYLPKGLGELTSLQRLDRFILSSVEESLSTAATLNELRDLNDLGNSLTIEHLEEVGNVELESNAALKEKERLQSLGLCWNSSERVVSGKDESLLNNLEPHPNLKWLQVSGYGGARFSSWLSSLTNLVQLEINQFYNCQYLPPLDDLSSLKSLSLIDSNVLEHLPPLDHLSSLESLVLSGFNVLEYVADSFPLPCSTSRKPFFSSLKELRIEGCPNLEGWWRTKNENQGSIAELPCFPCLSKLAVRDAPNLTCMPLFPSLDQDLALRGTSIMPFQQTLKMKMIEASMTSEEASSSSSGSTYHSYSSTTLPLSNLKLLTLTKIKDLEALPEEFLQNLTSLRSLQIWECLEFQSIPEGTCQLSSLEELDVRECHKLRALPDWILNLTSLRSLQIRECLKFQSIPEGTCQLSSLEKLNFRNCHKLGALPDWILNLTSLETLYIEDCLEFQSIAEGTCQLSSLEELDVRKCHKLRALPDWILNLTSLKTLYIEDCLEFQSIPKGTCQLSSLEELHVRKCHKLGALPDWILNLTSLRSLQIWECLEFQSIAEGTCQLSSLEELDVRKCHKLRALPDWILNLTSLKKLYIGDCLEFQSIPEGTCQLSSLEKLHVWKCHKLRALPDWILNLTSLKTLYIGDCLEFQSIPEGTCQLSSLEKLHVGNCHNLGALPDWILNLTSLKTLYIGDCLEFQSIPEGTCQLSSLEELHVWNCHNLGALPDWILNLTSLKTLYIEDCLEFQSIPKGTCQLSSLEELHVRKCHKLRALPDWILDLTSLKTLYIGDCLEFQSIPEGTCQLSSLEKLHVWKCHKLRALPDWILNLTSLKTLYIEDCLEFQSIPEGTCHLSSLEELHVRKCHKLGALPDWILNLTSLKTLYILECHELRCMPEGTPRLTSLQELFVYCHNLRPLPAWILNLTSLKHLYICECLQPPYLQERMQSLTTLEGLMVLCCPNRSSSNHSLKALLIWGCPHLYSRSVNHLWYSIEELIVQNCPNLGNLLYRIHEKMTFLETLKICKCPELQDLPKMMDGLTSSLQVLSISECPHLSAKCEKEIGELWPRIAHIPSIIIDGRQIQ